MTIYQCDRCKCGAQHKTALTGVLFYELCSTCVADLKQWVSEGAKTIKRDAKPFELLKLVLDNLNGDFTQADLTKQVRELKPGFSSQLTGPFVRECLRKGLIEVITPRSGKNFPVFRKTFQTDSAASPQSGAVEIDAEGRQRTGEAAQ